MTSPMLSSSIALSQLLAREHTTSSVGNVNIIEPKNTTGESSIPICYMPFVLLFSFKGAPSIFKFGYDGLAAALLAMEHLNTGNGTIVSELNGIDQTCPLKFTTKGFDTEALPDIGLNHVTRITDRDRIASEGGLVPCALIGALKSSVSTPSSVISGVRGFPQISPLSTSSALDDGGLYPLFGRTIPNDDGTAIPLMSKLTSWGVKYLAVIYIDDSYGSAYVKGILHAAEASPSDLRVETVGLPYLADDATVAKVVTQLKETAFTYFLGILLPIDVDRVMTEAYNQGIAGTGDHTWLLTDAGSVSRQQFSVGSPLERAFRGVGQLHSIPGVPGMDAFDKLSSSMRQLRDNDDDMSFLASQLPQDYPDGKSVNHTIITSSESFLKTPGIVAPFVYDAVVALGLAACRLTSTSEIDEYFTGEELFGAYVNSTFDGATGSVVFDSRTGTRDPRSAYFSLTNFVEDEDADVGQDTVKFKGVETNLYKAGVWDDLVPYTFHDGTHNIPADIPFIESNPNYLSTGWKVTGLVLCGIIVALAFGFSLWTCHNSEKHVVRASQPIFLHIIIFGALIMGLSIIPLSIDLGVTDQEGADAACMSFPWLIAIGFSLTFSALFTKTYRINQIMKSAVKMRRLKLTVTDVMKPMVVLLVINVAVLTLWTVIDPLQRNTIVVSQDKFGRNVETFGVCGSDHGYIFLAVLCVINLGSLIFAVVQAYRARIISTELQESTYIFVAMALILLVSFIGVPVLFIARDNTSAYYFVMAGLIFVVCSSILLLIFVPKVHALHWSSSQGATQRNSSRISGLSARDSSGSLTTGSDRFGLQLTSPKQIQSEMATENEKLKLLLSSKEEEIAGLRQILSKESSSACLAESVVIEEGKAVDIEEGKEDVV